MLAGFLLLLTSRGRTKGTWIPLLVLWGLVGPPLGAALEGLGGPVSAIVEECFSGECSFSEWSSWSQPHSMCGSTVYRRQMCVCPGLGVSNDSKCQGVPKIESQEFSSKEGCCHWDYGEETVDNCEVKGCGNGTWWRRQKCYCNGVLSKDEACKYNGPPATLKESCSVPCCSIKKEKYCPSNLDPPGKYCAMPWSVPTCVCPDDSKLPLLKCLVNWGTLLYPNDLFGVSFSSCKPSPSPITCRLDINNESSVCLTNSLQGADFIGCNGDYDFISPSCYIPGEYVYSTCVGSCANNVSIGRRLKMQKAREGVPCYYPPTTTVEECQLDCPKCTLGEWGPFSECSDPAGGVRWRARECSCSDPLLCPLEDSIEISSCSSTLPNCDWDKSTPPTACGSNGSHSNIPHCSCTDLSLPPGNISFCNGPIQTFTSSCTPNPCIQCNWILGEPSSCNATCTRRDLDAYGYINTNFECICNDTRTGILTPLASTSSPLQLSCPSTSTTQISTPCHKICHNNTCSLTAWGSWSSCSKQCSIGRRYRYRNCSCTNKADKSFCEPPIVTEDYENCNFQPCPPFTSDEWSAKAQWPAGLYNKTIPCTREPWGNLIRQKDTEYDRLKREWVSVHLNVFVGLDPVPLVVFAMHDALQYICNSSRTLDEVAKTYLTLFKQFNNGDTNLYAYQPWPSIGVEGDQSGPSLGLFVSQVQYGVDKNTLTGALLGFFGGLFIVVGFGATVYWVRRNGNSPPNQAHSATQKPHLRHEYDVRSSFSENAVKEDSTDLSSDGSTDLSAEETVL